MNAPFTLLYVIFLLLVAVSFSGQAVASDGPQRTGLSAGVQHENPLLPDGHRIALYLDCGGEQRAVAEGALSLTLVSGEDYAFPDIPGPAGTVFYDSEQVVFELAGLQDDKAYVLGFTWSDGDDSGRVQSVTFLTDGDNTGETVLPPVRAAAYNGGQPVPARVLLPVVPPFNRANTLRIAFVRESGPNALVNELWLLERVQSDPGARVLIVTGDDYDGHDWQTTAPALAGLLREDPRLEVSISESPAIFGSPLLMHYDAAVLHFKDYADRLPLGPEVREGLRAYVESGRGLTLSHFACGAFQEWDEFVTIAGRIWNPALRAHDPHGTFTVTMTGEDHPITRGMEDFEVLDELYTCLDGAAPIRVLAEATSVVDDEVYPMAFIVENTEGRIFHCVLGHDARAYAAGGVRTLYRQGVLWTLGKPPARE